MSQVRLFLVPVGAASDAGQEDAWTAVLEPEERDRAARFRWPRDRTTYIAAHALLRIALGAMTGTPPAALRFLALPGGKPVLVGHGAPQFNLTHCDGLVACALHDAAVGVDAEPASRRVDQAASRLMAAEEQAWLRGFPDGPARQAAFIRLWVVKEAYVKCLGVGLRLDPASYAFDLDGETARLRRAPPDQDPGPWSVTALAAGPRHVAAVAFGSGADPRPLQHWMSAAELGRRCQGAPEPLLAGNGSAAVPPATG